MYKFLTCSIICITLFSWNYAVARQPVTIENDAYLTRVSHKLAIILGEHVRRFGFVCDSISSINPFIMSEGFNVYCNNHRYSYDIENRGGNWIVTVD